MNIITQILNVFIGYLLFKDFCEHLPEDEQIPEINFYDEVKLTLEFLSFLLINILVIIIMFIILYYFINKNLINCICMMTLNNIEINCKRIKLMMS